VRISTRFDDEAKRRRTAALPPAPKG
jgi:hypothetical protein